MLRPPVARLILRDGWTNTRCPDTCSDRSTGFRSDVAPAGCTFIFALRMDEHPMSGHPFRPDSARPVARLILRGGWTNTRSPDTRSDRP